MTFCSTTNALPAHCGCSCHTVPGVSHVVACCEAPPYKSELTPFFRSILEQVRSQAVDSDRKSSN